MVYAEDLKSSALNWACGFESHPRHFKLISALIMNPDHPAGREEQREAERAELEAKIRAVIARNQEVLNAVPEEASAEEYWEALRREGRPCTLRVSQLDSDAVDPQPEMYILQEDDGQVEIIYFRDNGEPGYRFSIAMERIKAVE